MGARDGTCREGTSESSARPARTFTIGVRRVGAAGPVQSGTRRLRQSGDRYEVPVIHPDDIQPSARRGCRRAA
jgi:hypothetical protein